MEEPKSKVIEGIKSLISYIGDDPERDGLIDTPKRFQKMLDECLTSLAYAPPHIVSFKQKTKGQVIVGDIPFSSFCEHHIIPFVGKAYVGYLPKDNNVIGLSKIPRIVDYFSHRLQIQERLTQQITDYLYTKIKGFKPNGVIVVLKAEHLCMTVRGIKKADTVTTTSEIRGSYTDHALRDEFMMLSGVNKSL